MDAWLIFKIHQKESMFCMYDSFKANFFRIAFAVTIMYDVSTDLDHQHYCFFRTLQELNLCSGQSNRCNKKLCGITFYDKNGVN